MPGLQAQRDVVQRVKRAEALAHRRATSTPARAAARRRWRRHPVVDGVGDASRQDAERVATAPNTPLCIVTIFRAALVVAVVGGAAAVGQQQALEAAVVGLAHGGVHADVGGDAGEHEVADAARAQDQVEVGGVERALARLVDDGSPGARRELGDDLPARLAPDQDAAARPRIADAGARSCRERQRLLAGRSERSGRWPSRVCMT